MRSPAAGRCKGGGASRVLDEDGEAKLGEGNGPPAQHNRPKQRLLTAVAG